MKLDKSMISKVTGIMVALGCLSSQAMAGGVAGNDTITSDGQCELSRYYSWGGKNNCLPGTGKTPVAGVSWLQGQPQHANTTDPYYAGQWTISGSTTAYATVYCQGGQVFNIGTNSSGDCGKYGGDVQAIVCGASSGCAGHAAH